MEDSSYKSEETLYQKEDSEDAQNIKSDDTEETCTIETPAKPKNMSPGAVKLRNWLNKLLRIEMSDGRVLIGTFLCTDRDANIILGSCSEYLPEDEDGDSTSTHCEEPRMLGLVMVPGKHIVSICIDLSACGCKDEMETPLVEDINPEDVT